MNEILRVEKLAKSFWIGKKEINVLRDVNFRVNGGDMVAIAGASGAGKSTLLHILGTLDQPTSGEVFFGGKSLFQKKEVELAEFRNKNIGFVFQFHHLLGEFDALENVMIPALISGMDKKSAKEKAKSKLDEVGLSQRFSHKPSELSGGEQQRVAIARALILNPSLLLADEVTGNLDTKTGEHIYDLLKGLNQKYRMTMILVTHNEGLAQKLPQRLHIQDGTLR